MIVGVIKDVQESFNSNLDDSADDSQESFGVEVTKVEVQRLIERLLTAMPELKDVNNLEDAGFNNSTVMLIKS